MGISRYLVNDGFCKLLSALASKRHQICVVSPIQTSTMRKNNIRRTSTSFILTGSLLPINRASSNGRAKFMAQGMFWSSIFVTFIKSFDQAEGKDR